MEEIKEYTKKDLVTARELGLYDVASFLSDMQSRIINSDMQILLAEELLNRKKEILGDANRHINKNKEK